MHALGARDGWTGCVCMHRACILDYYPRVSRGRYKAPRKGEIIELTSFAPAHFNIACQIRSRMSCRSVVRWQEQLASCSVGRSFGCQLAGQVPVLRACKRFPLLRGLIFFFFPTPSVILNPDSRSHPGQVRCAPSLLVH